MASRIWQGGAEADVWTIAISGWVVAVIVLFWTSRGTARSDAEAQLQQTMREFAQARKAWEKEREQIVTDHRAQIDAIRASAVSFDLATSTVDEAAIKRFVGDIINRTKMRGERG